MNTLYGIKNCDTVKKARDWLGKRDIEYKFHDFRVDGLTIKQVATWIKELGLDTIVNKRSTTWKALDEATKTHFNETNAAEIIVKNPTLIKRPLLDTGEQKYIGFNDSEYTKIFN